MTTITRPSPPVNAQVRPLAVEMVITIDGQAYEVTPFAPGPDNVKAYRLAKRAADRKVYDVCQTAAGLVECDCPSYEFSYRDNGLATCKHGRALIMAGLVDYPDLPGPTAPAEDASNDAREAEATASADPVDPRTWDPALDDLEDDAPDPEDDGPSGWEDLDDDEERWTITPPALMSMAERVDLEEARFRSWGTRLGQALGDQMAATAAAIRATGAGDPGTYLDRLAAMRASGER